jgi:hypothetical protein
MRTKLYLDVMNAIRKAIPADVLPEYEEYQDILNVCEVCLLVVLVPEYERDPAKVANLLIRCQTVYRCWIRYLEEAIASADLSMLPEPRDFRTKLQAACSMALCWLYHISCLPKSGVLCEEGGLVPPSPAIAGDALQSTPRAFAVTSFQLNAEITPSAECSGNGCAARS